MKQMLHFFTFTCVFMACACFAIEGGWQVTHIEDQQVSSDHVIIATIDDFVYRNSSIRWVLGFEGCNSIKYQMDVWENQLFVHADSVFWEELTECEEEQQSLERKIGGLMKRVFNFQIISSYMLLSDRLGQVLIKLQRSSSPAMAEITGNWEIRTIHSQETSQLLQITPHHLIFCRGKSQMNYEVVKKNTLQTSGLTLGQCQNQQIADVMQDIAYFRRRGNEISFLSENFQSLLTAQFYLTLEQFQEREQKRKQLQEEEEKKRAELAEIRRQQILQQREQQRIEKLKQNLIPSQPLQGTWSITSIFGIPTIISSYQLQFTGEQVILSGGCNTHIGLYREEEDVLFMGVIRSTKKVCEVDEDGLYRRGLEKMHKYVVGFEDGKLALQIRDDRDKVVYQLEKVEESEENTRQKVQAERVELAEGRYMSLLLKRRDLGRKFTTITGNSLRIDICDGLVFSFTLRASTIDFLTDAQCQDPSEDMFLQYYRQVTQYRKDGDDIMLLNQQNQQIINLSLIP